METWGIAIIIGFVVALVVGIKVKNRNNDSEGGLVMGLLAGAVTVIVIVAARNYLGI